jgi:hypothetical protein
MLPLYLDTMTYHTQIFELDISFLGFPRFAWAGGKRA